LTRWSLDGRSAVDWTWEELSLSSFGISLFSRFAIGLSIIDWLLGRIIKAGVSLRAFFAYWFVVGSFVVY
jgi:hypothetical protein